ncbi:hypothetical protein [Kitasatospora sp. CB02891]|uniref:hypothetical protein n=1 Tax=Kitasatospora sp. CB02891 TaxID=2020329 RepID=UPI0012FDC70C|nr:hypothetical protein [Kitasatospora sp. CB02891]
MAGTRVGGAVRCGAGRRGRPSVASFGIEVTLVEPSAAATALPEVVGAEQPPLRVLFGAAPTHLVDQVCAERLRTRADRERVSVAADGDCPAHPPCPAAEFEQRSAVSGQRVKAISG